MAYKPDLSHWKSLGSDRKLSNAQYVEENMEDHQTFNSACILHATLDGMSARAEQVIALIGDYTDK